MSTRKLFLSYPRQNEATARSLAAELEKLGQEVWLDTHLSGGQHWWNTVLEKIRQCDCFVFVLNERSLGSRACLAELEYAHALGKLILPVAIADKIHDPLLPPYLARTQRVEANDPTQATRELAKALLAMGPTPALPEPPPVPPPVPISHLDALAQLVAADSLDQARQLSLVAELKQRLRNPDEREAAAALLAQMQRRTDLYAFVADDIRQALDAVDAPPPTMPPPGANFDPPTMPLPIPALRPSFATTSPSSSHSRRRVTIAACSFAGILLAAGAGFGITMAASGGNSTVDGSHVTAPPSPVTSEEELPTTAAPSTTQAVPSTTQAVPSTTDSSDVADPPPTTSTGSGSDTVLTLSDACAGGNSGACDSLAYNCMLADFVFCDALYDASQSGSGYEALALCSEGSMGSCNDLYWIAPISSDYSDFGSTCGYRFDPTFGSC